MYAFLDALFLVLFDSVILLSISFIINISYLKLEIGFCFARKEKIKRS